MKVVTRRQPIATRGIKNSRITDAAGVVVCDRLFEIRLIDVELFRQSRERLGLRGRHLGTDRTLVVRNFQEATVENCVSNRVRGLEMYVAGEPFPGLVHEAAAFVEEAATVLV